MAAASLCASSLHKLGFTVAIQWLFSSYAAHQRKEWMSGQGNQDQAAEVMNIISSL